MAWWPAPPEPERRARSNYSPSSFRRRVLSGDVGIHWSDAAGNFFQLTGTWCDLAELGGGLLLKRPIQPGTTARIESPWLRQSGEAVVRECDIAGECFRVGLEFVGGTRGQPTEAEAVEAGPVGQAAAVCVHCHARSLPGVARCPVCGRTRVPEETCALCGVNGHSKEVKVHVVNGFAAGGDGRYRAWPVHRGCLDGLRGEVRETFSVVRCPICCGEVDVEPVLSGQAPHAAGCARCGSAAEVMEAGWLKRADACVICSLPVYELIHAVWPGVEEGAWRSGDANFKHAVHRQCAHRLGLRR